MLATGNLPGLTAPGEGARAVGYLMESVLSFRSKEEKWQRKQKQSYLWSAIDSWGRDSHWRCLCKQGTFSRLPPAHLQMTEMLPEKPCEPRQGGAGLFMNLVCGPEHCTIISSLCGRGRLF